MKAPSFCITSNVFIFNHKFSFLRKTLFQTLKILSFKLWNFRFQSSLLKKNSKWQHLHKRYTTLSVIPESRKSLKVFPNFSRYGKTQDIPLIIQYLLRAQSIAPLITQMLPQIPDVFCASLMHHKRSSWSGCENTKSADN